MSSDIIVQSGQTYSNKPNTRYYEVERVYNGLVDIIVAAGNDLYYRQVTLEELEQQISEGWLIRDC